MKIKQFAYYPIFLTIIICLIIFTLSRVALCIWHFDLVKDNLLNIALMGIRYDLSIIATLFALSFLLRFLVNFVPSLFKYYNYFERVYLTIALLLVTLLELSTPSFILEYGVRPNYIYIEYLIYPKEVISMLANGHSVEVIVLSLILAAIAFVFFKKLSAIYANIKAPSVLSNVLALVLLVIATPLAIRSTLGHKPLNPSNASFSPIPLANSISYNSLFNVFYCLRHINDNTIKANQIYAFDRKENVLNNLKYLSNNDFTHTQNCPINQKITPAIFSDKKRNVVLIIEESLGARYVKSLGGDEIAVNIDKLKDESWFFTRLYATGHRSVRGLEAITASNPPSPLASIVKLQHPHEITTLSGIFKKLGYKTSFIYGGESHFDNMRRYFYDNGVDLVIEQKDYINPKHVSSWGVSDEDLFEKANGLFEKWHQENAPFCSIIFSSSFHDPFDIPEGKVDLGKVQTNDPKRLLAAKYADYALGNFIKLAKTKDYYKDTIFVIIADHDSRVRGIDDFPLTNYSIPALILSPDIKPRVDDRIVSQIDILPTILSLASVSGELPIVGQDLTKDNIIQRGLVGYNDIFGYVTIEDGNERFYVLNPNQQAQKYKINEHNRIQLLEDNVPKEKLSLPISFENLALTIYENEYNRQDCIKELKQE